MLKVASVKPIDRKKTEIKIILEIHQGLNSFRPLGMQPEQNTNDQGAKSP